MNSSRLERAVFKAVVKGIGIYQLILGAVDLASVLMLKLNIKIVATGLPSHQEEYVGWAIFHFFVAVLLLYRTDLAIRLAFPRTESGG